MRVAAHHGLPSARSQPEIAIEVPGGGRLTLRRVGEQVELRDADGNEMSFQQGRVECDTLKANAVIAQSDTPGAGNAW